MPVKFSEFTIGAINADLEIVGFNSATPTNVQVSYTDIKNDILASAITGSGVTGQVAYWNGTNSQTGSNNLFWDAANNRFGVLNSSPVFDIHLGTISKNTNSIINAISDNARRAGLSIDTGIDTRFFAGYVGSTTYNGAQGEVYIGSPGGNTLAFGQITSIRARLYQSGNLVIQNGGTFTDSGQRLQVYGDAFIKGSGATSATNALLIQNNITAPLFFVQNNGLTIARGTTNNSTDSIFAVQQQNGNTRFFVNAAGQSLISGDAYQATDVMLRIDRNFNPTSGTATHTTLIAIPTINQTGGANGITRGVYVAPILTAAADWRSIQWDNNTGWGLYGAGTADNYLAGKLLIGTTTASTFNLDVNGTARVSGAMTFNNLVTNTSGGFVHSSTSPTNDAFYTLQSGVERFYVKSGGYCKSTSNIVTDANGVPALASSAISQIDSTTKGFLPPRMTTTQINAISTPAEGLQVYNTTINHMCVYQAGAWVKLSHSPM